MAQFDYVLQAFTVYVDGIGKAGTGEKCMTPKIKKKTEDFRGGGMRAARKVSFGYEAFELELELSAYDPQIIGKGALGLRNVPITIRGYFEGDQGKQHTGIIQCVGEFMEIDGEAWDASKKAKLKAKGALSALKLDIDAATIYDINIENDIYEFNGVDEYAPVRAALGL